MKRARNQIKKIILLGDSGVGKTSIMNRYVNNEFSGQYKATIGADFLTKSVEVGETFISLQIWDTAGQERYQSLGIAFYKGADACILVFDLTSKKSFEKVDKWVHEFCEKGNITLDDNLPFVLVGNKLDLLAKREVEKEDIEMWMSKVTKHYSMKYFPVSAKNDTGIKDAFNYVGQQVVNRIVDYEDLDSFVPHDYVDDEDDENGKQNYCSWLKGRC